MKKILPYALTFAFFFGGFMAMFYSLDHGVQKVQHAQQQSQRG